LALLIASSLSLAPNAFSGPATNTIQFNRDVRPILSENCFACHGHDKNQRKAKLRLDVRDVALERGAIVPGKPEESKLVEHIFSTDPDETMPPPKSNKKLTAEQKELLKKWIASGGEYEPHWAYIEPKRFPPQQTRNSQWVRNPIDAFILGSLEAKGIQPSPEADKRTLLRRLSLDLIGLPPTVFELETFLSDKSSGAYARQVDRLLSSPHFGERMAVPWLDLVRDDALKERLADLTRQFERDGYRPEALESMVGADEAKTRWAALAAFYREHGHFLVTNGPYRLKAWSATGATLEVFRDLSYPLGVGSYDTYAVPRRGYITKVERDKSGLRLSGDIETVMKFMRDYRLERQPLPAVEALVRKRAAPECRYAVTDAEGRMVLAGTTQPQEDLSFAIELDDRLPAGRYTVSAEIIVNGNAMNAEIKRIPVTVSGGR